VTLPEISQVYVGFLATVTATPQLVCGAECSEVRFFSEAEVPWSDLSYPDIGVYLRMYFEECRSGSHPIHCGNIDAANVSNKAYRIATMEHAQWRRPSFKPSDED
jgi:hypothetical protein